ncbi:MAG: glycosyltransferase [Chloroflexi bacterium]|nr:glycosyltransferase [Chloroflexota bacterium]
MTAHLRPKPYAWEVIVADDGSVDRTAEIATAVAKAEPRVRLLKLSHGGKGWAVKNGMLASQARWRFLCDADLSMPPEQIDRFLPGDSDPQFDIGVGSREAPGARRFNEPFKRHILGRVYNRLVRIIAVRGLNDTQCGFKLFRGVHAPLLFGRQTLPGFGFDVEVLYLARKAGLRLREVPIDWHYGGGSRMTLCKGASGFLDILRVRWNAIRGRYSEKVGASVEGASKPTPSPMSRQPSGLASPIEGEEAKRPQVVVVIPTYNEAENLPVVFDELRKQNIPDLGFVIVDDASPDGTGQVAENLASTYPGYFKVLHRPGKLGLGKAYVDGFAEALRSRAEFIVEMDADLSHPPAEVPLMLDKARDADVVTGSRYSKGGSADPSWSFSRQMLSRIGNFGIRRLVGLRVHDATSGFKVFRRSALERLPFSRFRNAGFGFQAEVAHWCEFYRMKVVEHPYRFAQRRAGKSKMSTRIVLEALRTLLPLRFHRPPKQHA